MYDYCLTNNYIKDNICVLCADDIMIKKHLYKPELLNELSEYILNVSGFKLIFTNKIMNEDYLNILDLHQLININENNYKYDEIVLRKILDNLNPERWNDRNQWVEIYCIFLNEDIPLSIFDEYSKKNSKFNNKKNREKLLGLKKWITVLNLEH